MIAELDLRGNSIGVEGVRHLSEALKNNTVRFLYIFHGFPCRCIFELCFLQTLTNLNLSGNSIGDQGIKYLSESLSNTSVSSSYSLFDENSVIILLEH